MAKGTVVQLRYVLFSIEDKVRTKLGTYKSPIDAWLEGEKLGKGKYTISAEHKIGGVWILGGGVSLYFGETLAHVEEVQVG